MLVSLIVTNYNYSKFLNRCINSLINQSLDRNTFEVIFVDDCSTDNSVKILNDYLNFKNFKLIKNKKNLGVAASANKAIKIARGKYVIRVDADDYVSEEFLKILSLYMETNTEYLGVACDYYLVHENNKIRRMSCENHPISCGIMYKKKELIKYGSYNSKFRHREEEELRLRLGSKYQIFKLNIPLYRYRIHKSNKTFQKDYSFLFRDKIINYNKKIDKNNSKYKYLKNIVAIIPAKGISKRFQNKNMHKVWGEPMIFWTINAAKKSKYIKKIYVSSEDDKILKYATNQKVEAIKRPKNLSKDNVFKIKVIQDTIERISNKKNKFSLVVSLQANSPEIVHQDIDNAINHLIKFDLNEVVSLDDNLNQNAAIRVMKPETVFQDSLSVYFGGIKTNITDIHYKTDLKKIKLKNKIN